jgi:polysaccharide biosynthesis/export protein
MRAATMRMALLGLSLGLAVGQASAEIPANVMAQFSQLSPAQQEAVAAQYGVDLSQLKSQQGDASQAAPMPATLAPRTVDNSQATQRQPIIQNSSLQPFGYNVFAAQPTSQTPLTDIPVPDDYVVGPGDELRVQMYGKENASYKLKVNRDGSVEFPKLGPISVAGLTFQQVSNTLQSRIAEQFIGVESAISFGALRTMQVFIMGDAYQPGAYNVNALTTVTQALQIAGGIDTVGSLRKIQVKRAGKTIQNVDLYKMLIWGNTEQDIRLRAGDTIFVPAKGTEVTVDGLVKRPAIYELSGPAAIGSVLDVAGGLKAEALREVMVTRRGEEGTQVFNLNLASGSDRNFTIRDGDKIEAKPTTTEFSKAIAIKGAVVREGTYSYQPGIRISQLLKDPRRDLKATADLDYALVVREINPRHDIEVIQFNLGQAINQQDGVNDLLLQPRDTLLVFDRDVKGYFPNNVPMADKPGVGTAQISASSSQAETQRQDKALALAQQDMRANQVLDRSTGALVNKNELSQPSNNLELNDVAKGSASNTVVKNSREELLAPVIEKLKAQSSHENPVQIAEVRGEVKFPGVYPLGRYTTQADLLTAAGGLKETAFTAELSRVNEAADGSLSIVYERYSLPQLLASSAPKAISKDSLNVLANPDWRGQATVQLFGEVKYPGTYTVRRGEKMSDLLKRAGGVTQFGNANGSVFARESLRRQEADRLTYIKEQLQQEIATMSLRRQTGNLGVRSSSPTEASELVGKLDSSQAIGRMTISLPAILNGDKRADVVLEDGDKLYVPSFQNVISVAGQVQMPTSHVFDPALSIQDYIDRSGGTKKQADTDRIYVIKANGAVMLPSSNYWFSRSNQVLEPGDTIIAPIDTDYLDSLSTWSTATQMMYQLGVAWAAIKN